MQLLSGCEKVFLFVCYIIALLTAILSTVLPYWVSTRVELGLQVVKVNKDMNSGLWFQYQNLVYNPRPSVESNEGLKELLGTSLYTDGVKSVTGLMMTALSLLVFGFVYSIISSSSCSNCTSQRDSKVQLVVMAVMPFIAAVLMAVAVVVFYKEVLDEYKLSEDKKHVGASFWLAVTSSVISCVTGGFIICLGVCRRDEN